METPLASVRLAGEKFGFKFKDVWRNEVKLTLGKKLGLGFGCVLALMVLSAILTYMKASAIKETQDLILTVRVPTISALKDLQRDLNQAQSKGRQVILAGTSPDRREAARRIFDSNC